MGAKQSRKELTANMADEYGSDGLDDPPQNDLPAWMVAEGSGGSSVSSPLADDSLHSAPKRRLSWQEALHPVTTTTSSSNSESGTGGGVVATHRLVDPFVAVVRLVNGLTALATAAIVVTQVMLMYRAIALSRSADANRYPLPFRDVVLRGYGVALALYSLAVEATALVFSYGAGNRSRGGAWAVGNSWAARSWALRGLLHILVGTLALTKGPEWQYAGGATPGVMSPYLDAGLLYEMPAFAMIVAGALYVLANMCCLNVLHTRRVTRARIRKAQEQGMLEKLYMERGDDSSNDITL